MSCRRRCRCVVHTQFEHTFYAYIHTIYAPQTNAGCRISSATVSIPIEHTTRSHDDADAVILRRRNRRETSTTCLFITRARARQRACMRFYGAGKLVRSIQAAAAAASSRARAHNKSASCDLSCEQCMQRSRNGHVTRTPALVFVRVRVSKDYTAPATEKTRRATQMQ